MSDFEYRFIVHTYIPSSTLTVASRSDGSDIIIDRTNKRIIENVWEDQQITKSGLRTSVRGQGRNRTSNVLALLLLRALHRTTYQLDLVVVSAFRSECFRRVTCGIYLPFVCRNSSSYVYDDEYIKCTYNVYNLYFVENLEEFGKKRVRLQFLVTRTRICNMLYCSVIPYRCIIYLPLSRRRPHLRRPNRVRKQPVSCVARMTETVVRWSVWDNWIDRSHPRRTPMPILGTRS